MSKIIGIDLFCGIGGLTQGLVKAGINIKAGFDIDGSCEKSFTQKNNGSPNFIKCDIKKMNKNDFEKYFLDLKDDDYKLVAGCAPCQPYSMYQKNKDHESRTKHSSYGLIIEYLKVVEYIQPDFVIMENVRELKNDQFFKNEFLSYFKDNNYFIDYKIVDMQDYGAPQRRKRLLFLATKMTIPNFTNFTINTDLVIKKKSVFDAIGHLPKINAGDIDKHDPIHQSSKLSDLNLQRIKHSIPGGTWKDWPKQLLLECYKKETGKTFTSVYGRMRADDVAPTLTTQFTRYGTGRYGHYEQDRAISLREGAILQTFPNDYVFDKSIGTTAISRQIGNAVPPIFSEILGKDLVRKLKKTPTR